MYVFCKGALDHLCQQQYSGALTVRQCPSTPLMLAFRLSAASGTQHTPVAVDCCCGSAVV